jgi:hypothetical protein
VSGPEAFFLDTLPFDWTRPEARRLHAVLAGVFPFPEPVIEIARAAGVAPAAVAWDQPMRSVWHELITTARNRGRLRELLARAAEASRLAAAALEDLGVVEPRGADPFPPAGAGLDGLTAGEIAMALSGFCPLAGPGELEAFGRRVLGEVYCALLRGHLVCVAERGPDGPRTVLVLDPREGGACHE